MKAETSPIVTAASSLHPPPFYPLFLSAATGYPSAQAALKEQFLFGQQEAVVAALLFVAEEMAV